MPEGDGYDYKIEAKAYTASSSGASASSGERPDEQELYHSKSWWTTYVFSQDAKYIGVQYLCAATAIAVLGLVLSVLMRVQLAYPGLNVLDPSTYYQSVTMHGMIMVIFFLTALFLGGTLVPKTFNPKTSLAFGHSAVVDARAVIKEIKKQLKINVSLKRKIHIIALPQGTFLNAV